MKISPLLPCSPAHFQARFITLLLGVTFVAAEPALCLPPSEDVPEEVLRTEIITEARSPIDGKSLTAAEYAQLQAELAQPSTPPKLSPKIRRLIFLLRVRRLLRTVAPFIPIP
jgi:hypothetical protein